MTHRAGQITAAIAQTLAAWPDIGVPSVFQDREFSMQEASGEIPCITVNEGSDDPVSDEGNDNVAFIDSVIDFEIVGYATGRREPDVKAELRRQRAEIHRALLAYLGTGTDPLQLAFVIAIKYGGASKADMSVLGDTTAGRMASLWRVHYRMNFADPND